MDLIITDANHTPLRAVGSYTLDLAYGSEENDFELSGVAPMPEAGALVMVDGTEYGGVVDSVSSDGTVTGRTWHGVLAAKILTPDDGQDYLTVSGQIGAILDALFSRIGLAGLFQADANSTNVAYRFDRYTDAYGGISAMLAAQGMKLRLSWADGMVHATAEPIRVVDDTIDSDLLKFASTRDHRPINHLIGLGSGELRDRAVSHWYADADGTVSQTQTLHGLDERAAVYDYSNAKADELAENTRDKLKELQSQGELDVTVNDTGLSFDVGDVLVGRDHTLGQTVRATIAKKIVKATDGVISVSYEAGTLTARQSSLSGSGESSTTGGGGHAYYAGEGLTLVDYTFSADVTDTDLTRVETTAQQAYKLASDYSSAIGKAQQDAADALATAETKIGAITATAPLHATRSDDAVTISAEAATRTTAGLMSAADKTKLDGISSGANAYTLPTAAIGRLGGVKPDGQTITITTDGTITAHATGGQTVNPWPIGSVYQNTTGTNPGSVFGGTWRQMPSIGAYTWERTS